MEKTNNEGNFTETEESEDSVEARQGRVGKKVTNPWQSL